MGPRLLAGRRRKTPSSRLERRKKKSRLCEIFFWPAWRARGLFHDAASPGFRLITEVGAFYFP